MIAVIIVLILILATVVFGFFSAKLSDYNHCVLATIFGVLAIVVGIITVISFIGVPITVVETASFAKQYEATKNTIQISRADPETTSAERTALILKVIETNNRIADYKYWRSVPILKYAYNSQIDNMEYLK